MGYTTGKKGVWRQKTGWGKQVGVSKNAQNGPPSPRFSMK